MKKNLLGISLITMAGLYGILAGVLILVFIITGQPIIWGVVIGIVVLIIQFLLAPFFTDLSMRWFYRASRDYEFPEYLNNFISEQANKHKMKYPKMYYIDDGAPNAFTYGRTKNDARIVLTRGILELLTEEEVKAVVSHEMGHAVHYDMLFMTVAQLVPLVLYGVYVMFADRRSSSDNDDNKLALVGYLAYILYIISQYIILWLSRTREYFADSFAIEETKNPNALASALVKIGYGLIANTSDTKNNMSASKPNALGIFNINQAKSLVVDTAGKAEVSKDRIKNAMKWEKWNTWAKYYELHSTHPLISKRLEAISERSKEFNQETFIEFDLAKEESYFGYFLFEVLVKFLPSIAIFITIIILIAMQAVNATVIALGAIVALGLMFLGFSLAHKNKGRRERTVADLLGEVKVSAVTSIPVVVKGSVIGKGNPGYVFSEDFVLKDETGIIYLDYNQPLFILNKIFALFRSQNYIDKEITVTGWYRRSPVPYIEIYKMEIDGKTKRIFTYPLARILYALGFIGLLIFLITTLV